jgi:hypothetical protein
LTLISGNKKTYGIENLIARMCAVKTAAARRPRLSHALDVLVIAAALAAAS